MTSYRPDFETFVRLASDGAISFPSIASCSATRSRRSPRSARCSAGGSSFLFESVVGGETDRPLQLPRRPSRSCSIEACGRNVVDHARRDTQQTFEAADPLDELADGCSPSIRAVHVPGLPRFCGGAVGYAGYDTSATSSACRTPRRTTASCPTCPSRSTTAWSIFDHINKTVLVVAHARRRRARPAGEPTTRPAAGSTNSVERLQHGRGRPAADRHRRSAASRRLDWTVRTSRRPSSKRRSASARSTSTPATSSRSCSASGCRPRRRRRPFDIYRALRVVNPSPFMFLLRTPDVHAGRQLAGDHGPRRGRRGDRSARWPARAAAGHDRGGRPAPRRGTARRPEGAGRAHHAGRPGPQRRRPRRRSTARVAAQRRDGGRALQPRHAHHVERDRPAGRRARRRSTPCGRACRRARSPARRRCGRWRSSTNSNRTAAARTAGRSATSTSPATWTPASPCGRWSCRARRPTSRPAPGIVADSVPREEYQETLNKAKGMLEGDRRGQRQL